MNAKSSRPWWLRKRILFPLALVAGLPIAAAIAYLNSDISSIVIYNETGTPLPPLLVRACGQERGFSALAERESVEFDLKPAGEATPVHLELATTPAWHWDGEPIPPRGGHIVTVRLWPGGQVEAFSEISWWRKTFN